MFSIAEEYLREDLLDFVGSRQSQSGIIWGKKDITCVIITSGGKGGESLGYADGWSDDGSFLYTGQGANGDQDPDKFANSLLIKGERSILLFTTKDPSAAQRKEKKNNKKLYKFEGIFEVKSWDYFKHTEGKRANDKLIQFRLVPVSNIYNIYTPSGLQSEVDNTTSTLAELREIVKNYSSTPQQGVIATSEYYYRSKKIVAYAICRADGKCENCRKHAPFEDSKGNLFLEVHHIHRLADGGPDLPKNVAALCPNCHREAHFGKNRDSIRRMLSAYIEEKEEVLDNQTKKGLLI